MRLAYIAKIILVVVIGLGTLAVAYYVSYERGKRANLSLTPTQVSFPTPSISNLQTTPSPTQTFTPSPTLTPSPQIEKDANGWITVRDEKDGYEIKYPEGITEGIPSVMVTNTSDNLLSKCPANDEPGPLKTEGEKTTINNITYCENIATEGAAGSVFESFTYRTIKDKKLYTISFSAIQFYDCTFFVDQANQKDCEKSNENKGQVT